LDLLTARHEPQVIVKEVLVDQDGYGIVDDNSRLEEIPAELTSEGSGESASDD
jgi:hypothetical protein